MPVDSASSLRSARRVSSALRSLASFSSLSRSRSACSSSTSGSSEGLRVSRVGSFVAGSAARVASRSARTRFIASRVARRAARSGCRSNSERSRVSSADSASTSAPSAASSSPSRADTCCASPVSAEDSSCDCLSALSSSPPGSRRPLVLAFSASMREERVDSSERRASCSPRSPLSCSATARELARSASSWPAPSAGSARSTARRAARRFMTEVGSSNPGATLLTMNAGDSRGLGRCTMVGARWKTGQSTVFRGEERQAA